jgi:hypothetical protein
MPVTVVGLAQQTSSNTGMPIGEDQAQKTFKLYFSFTVTGSYVAGGFTLDLTQLFTASAGGPGASLTTPAVPLRVELMSAAPSSVAQTGLYVYSYAPGTTVANGKVQIFTTGAAAQAALVEFTAGALPAGVLADTIQGEATFPKL